MRHSFHTTPLHVDRGTYDGYDVYMRATAQPWHPRLHLNMRSTAPRPSNGGGASAPGQCYGSPRDLRRAKTARQCGCSRHARQGTKISEKWCRQAIPAALPGWAPRPAAILRRCPRRLLSGASQRASATQNPQSVYYRKCIFWDHYPCLSYHQP